MPTNPGDVAPRLELHVRRAVWIAWGVTMVVASVLYALKAAEDRSAFVRWRHQVLEIGQGVDIWHDFYFPNPPILPLTLYPLMLLPAVAGALVWYAIKVGMTTWSALALRKMARGHGARLKPWAFGIVLLLALRPILSDLQHGNINLLILFLIVACLQLWRNRHDAAAGMVLALAIAYKVTPALFVPYFLYKRSWKLVASTMLGLVLFLLVVPGALIGPRFNWQCLMSWRQNIISPFVEGETIASVQEVNQSMPGVLTRFLTAPKVKGEHGNGHIDGDLVGLNLVAWEPEVVARLAKAGGIAFVALLAWLCRTKTSRRDDPRLLGEFALVVLTMLFVSERSWKHHYVTVLLPYTYLVYQAVAAPVSRRVRVVLGGSLVLSALLMASSSSDLSDLVAGEGAHEVALYYGMFFWSALVLFIATAWRVRVDRLQSAGREQSGEATPPQALVPSPHLGQVGERVPTR